MVLSRRLLSSALLAAIFATSNLFAGYNQDFAATFPDDNPDAKPGLVTVILTNEDGDTIMPFVNFEVPGLTDYVGRHMAAARTGGAHANQEISAITSSYTNGANTTDTLYDVNPFPEVIGNGVYEPDVGVVTDDFIIMAEDGIGGIRSGVVWDQAYDGGYDSVTHSFQFRISGEGNPANDQADGLGWAYVNSNIEDPLDIPEGAIGEEPNIPGSFGVGFDIWNNGGAEGGNSVSLHFDGRQLSDGSVAIDEGTTDPNTGDDWGFNSFETDEIIEAQIIVTAGDPLPGVGDPVELKGGSQYQVWNRGGAAPSLEQNSGMDGFLRVAEESGGVANVVAFDHDGSEATTEHNISFNFRGLNENANRADGMSFLLVPIEDYDSEGADLIDFGPHEEPNLAGAFGIGFDTFNNDAAPQDEPEEMANTGNHVSLHFDGEKLLQENFSLEDDINLVIDDDSVWHTASIQINGDDVTITLIDGEDGSEHTISETIPGLSDMGAVRPAFAARTGGAFDHYDIDNFLMNVSLNPCDFDGDGAIGIADVDLLLAASASGANEGKFDITSDGLVNLDDIKALITGADKLNTWMGDANLDGEFNSGDLVTVFSEGKFETGEAATWGQGDWNGDGTFGSGDLVAAFQDGGFELGKRGAVASVPEPSSLVLLAIGFLGLVGRSRRRS